MNAGVLLRVWAAFAVVTLVSCGGGVTDSTPVVPPVANAGPAMTILAGSTAQLDGASSVDPAGNALTYLWAVTSTPAGSAVTSASLSSATASTPAFVPDVSGTYVVSLVVSAGQVSSAPASVSITAVAASDVSIISDQVEPLSGSTQLSLSHSLGALPVSWFLDLSQIGVGATATWNTGLSSNGAHQVFARLQLPGNKTVDIKRTLTVANSSVTISSLVSGTSGNVFVDVRATSPFGITRVSASFDGTPVGVLFAPNACSRPCFGTNDVYRFTVDAVKAGSGSHLMVVAAEDGSASSRQLMVAVPISNAPRVELAEPVDGAIVHGTLQVGGTSSSDKPGAVRVVVSLGDVPFLTTSASSFGGTYDLAGLAPGSYVMKILATDSTGSVTRIERQVVVASSARLARAPQLSLGSNGRLLAADGDHIVYSAEDQTVRLRNTLAGTEVPLQGGAIAYGGDWQISNGRVYSFGQGSDCSVNFVCVYQWEANGSRTNLSLANPWAGTSYQQHPVAKAGVVLWCNDGANSFTLFDVAADRYTQIAPPAGVRRVGNWMFDLAVVNGVTHVVYWATAETTGSVSEYDVYLWRSDSQSSVRMSSPGLGSTYVATDGVRMAWTQLSPALSSTDPRTLLAMPLSGGTATAQSPAMVEFLLRDGVLVWVEPTAGTSVIKVATGSTATTLAGGRAAGLLGTAAGKVVYSSANKLYSWNSATSETRLLLDAVPNEIRVTAESVYLVLGSTKALYKLPLD